MFIIPIFDRRRPHLAPRYRAEVTISVRDDDKQLLLWVQQRFGAKVRWYNNRRSKTKANPCVRWGTHNIQIIDSVLAVLRQGVAPSKKKKEIEVMQKFIDIKKMAPRGRVAWSDIALKKQKELYLELKSLKQYH